MSLGKLLKKERKSRGLTLQDVADKAAISKSYLFDLEADKCCPTISVCIRLSTALLIPIECMAIEESRTKRTKP